MSEQSIANNVYQGIIDEGAKTIRTESAAFNVLASQIANAGNTVKLVCEYRDEAETTDENILKFRKYKEDLLANLRENEEKVEAYIVSAGLVDVSAIDVEAVTAQAKEKATLIKGLRNALTPLPGGTEALADIPELAKLPGVTRASSGSTSDIKRPRLSQITADGVDIFTVTPAKDGKEGKRINTMGTLATHLTKEGYKTANNEAISTTYLQAHLYESAGVSDLSTLKGRPIEFSLALLKGEANETINVVATPSV